MREQHDEDDDEREVGRVQQRAPGGQIAAVVDPGPPSLPGDHPGGGTPRVLVTPPHENTRQTLRVVIGERCAEARRRIGYTQRGLAKALGMSPSWIREYEGAGQFAPAWLIVTLAEAARLPVCWFYGYGGGCR